MTAAQQRATFGGLRFAALPEVVLSTACADGRGTATRGYVRNTTLSGSSPASIRSV